MPGGLLAAWRVWWCSCVLDLCGLFGMGVCVCVCGGGIGLGSV